MICYIYIIYLKPYVLLCSLHLLYKIKWLKEGKKWTKWNKNKNVVGWIIWLLSQVSSLLSGCRVCRGLERLNSHEESPLLLSCDFSPNGIRELCTLQSSSSENIGNTKLLWTVPAWCNMCSWTDFRQRDRSKTEGQEKGKEKKWFGLKVESCLLFWAWLWVRARKENVDTTGHY